jgi:hypothetical protein
LRKIDHDTESLNEHPRGTASFSSRERSSTHHRTALPPVAIVDRVSSLNPDDTVFEVHSVGLNTNPYVYARWLVDLDRKRSKSGNRYLIELKDGNSFTLTADEVIGRAIATGLYL